MTYRHSQFKLSTIDNPHSPFTNWYQWYLEDIRLGYDTCGLLARMTMATEEIDDEADLQAMRDIVEQNYSGKHVLVLESDFNS